MDPANEDQAFTGWCIIGFVLFGWLVQLIWDWFEPLDPFDFLFPMQQGGFQIVHPTWGEMFWEYVVHPSAIMYAWVAGLAAQLLPPVQFPFLWNSFNNAFNYFYMTDASEWHQGIAENAIVYYVSRVWYYLTGEGQ